MDRLTGEDHDLDADDSRLTPRVPPAARRRRRNPFAFSALAVIVVALLVVVANGLGDATLFFRNADEAVAQRDELSDRRFRIQGLVDGGSITDTDRGVDFVITYNGVDVTISHIGDPPDLFQPGIPVVLEGRWQQLDATEVAAPVEGLPTDQGYFFSSDRFFVKHTEVYVEDNPDRVDDYEESGIQSGDDGG
ncbi:MAG: cytochrome c maturation protein CcmE domain-containing protein [Acidimicrobiales bacterium]